MALTSDDKFLISGSDDRCIKVFDLTAKKEVHYFQNIHNSQFIEKCLDLTLR